MLVMMILMLVIIMIMISFVDDKGVPKNFFLILHFFQPECQMVYREYLSEIFVAYLFDTPQKIFLRIFLFVMVIPFFHWRLSSDG